MTFGGFRIQHEGTRLALISEGRIWARVTTFAGSFKIRRSALRALRPERLDPADEARLAARLGGGEALDTTDLDAGAEIEDDAAIDTTTEATQEALA